MSEQSPSVRLGARWNRLEARSLVMGRNFHISVLKLKYKPKIYIVASEGDVLHIVQIQMHRKCAYTWVHLCYKLRKLAF